MTAPPPRLVLVPREMLDIVLSNADIEIRMSMRPTEHSVALGQIKNLRSMLSSAPEAPSEEMVEIIARVIDPEAWRHRDRFPGRSSYGDGIADRVDVSRQKAQGVLAALLAGQPQPTTTEGEPK